MTTYTNFREAIQSNKTFQLKRHMLTSQWHYRKNRDCQSDEDTLSGDHECLYVSIHPVAVEICWKSQKSDWLVAPEEWSGDPQDIHFVNHFIQSLQQFFRIFKLDQSVGTTDPHCHPSGMSHMAKNNSRPFGANHESVSSVLFATYCNIVEK